MVSNIIFDNKKYFKIEKFEAIKFRVELIFFILWVSSYLISSTIIFPKFFKNASSSHRAPHSPLPRSTQLYSRGKY